MTAFIVPATAFLVAAALAPSALAQVTATGTNGVTNPPQPTLGTAVNQTSMSRLISANSYDDFCIFAPPQAGDTIGDTEGEEVAWCTKPRNNARVIPDGTITAVHFVKTPLYVQITGFGDLTKINIQQGDEGGELDPHGATGLGNPVGGNVTSNVSGSDVFYQEWMNYVAYDSFCLRICTAENSTYSAAIECQHTFDLMGCEWVMPGDYTQDTFTSCDGDSSYPPGVYPEANGETSTFAQRYTNTVPGNEFTIGDTSTPATPYSTPASSNCQTYSSFSNGVTLAASSTAAASSGSAKSAAASASGSVASSSRGAAASASRTGTSSKASSVASSASSGTAVAAGSQVRTPVLAVVAAVVVGLGAGALII